MRQCERAAEAIDAFESALAGESLTNAEKDLVGAVFCAVAASVAISPAGVLDWYELC